MGFTGRITADVFFQKGTDNMCKPQAEIQNQLFALADARYRDFHSRLIPTVSKEKIIGVRTPSLRALARQYRGTDAAAEFMSVLPHRFYEEDNLHVCFLEQLLDYDELIVQLERFLPYIDNWATCDMLRPKIFKKHTEKLIRNIKKWLTSDRIYTVRFGMGMLMAFYLNDAFKPEYPELVCLVRSDEYYIKMMTAWYFATALSKQYDAVLPYLEQKRLDTWTHNKTIQKAVESYRITPEQKAYLKKLKIK